MTKTFDELCETIISGTQPQQGQIPPAKPGTTPQPNTPQPTPSVPQQNNQQPNDDELFKALQQKMNDQKFRDALLKMLNPQQQNAAASNKPV